MFITRRSFILRYAGAACGAAAVSALPSHRAAAEAGERTAEEILVNHVGFTPSAGKFCLVAGTVGRSFELLHAASGRVVHEGRMDRVSASGCNLAALAYSRIVGLPHSVPSEFKMGMRLWDPLRDYFAFLQRRRAGELSLMQWLGGLCHRQTFPVFRWSDPRPTISRAMRMMRRSRPGHRPRGSQSPSPSC